MLKRKKAPEVEVIEEYVNFNSDDFLFLMNKKSKKVVRGNKFPDNVLTVPLENVSFHYEVSVLKWKYVYHVRIASERDLSKEALKCYEIMELLEDAQIKKVVSDIGSLYPKLFKESTVDMPKGINDEGSNESRKVHMRGHYFGFFLAIINE